jgi:26S proteasome regulatory subunit T3
MPESRSLKRELVRAQEEIKRIQSVPLVIGQFMEAIDQKYVNLSFVLPIRVADIVKHWDSTIVNRLELCRPHTFNARPRKAQAIIFRRPPSSLEFSR